MKKSMKRLMATGLILALTLSVTTGCGGTSKPEQPKSQTSKQKAEEPVGNEVRKFTDSLGREVAIPKTVNRIVPSGKLAQLYLMMACPEKLVSVSKKPTKWDKVKEDLPVTGQLYGGKGEFNREEVLKLNPQIIIDLGEKKKTIREDMDKIQRETGIPTVFIEAGIDQTAQAFRTLGELTGTKEHCDALAKFAEDAVAFAKKASGNIPEKQRIRIYQTSTDDGLGADLDGTAHVEVMHRIGAVNAAEAKAVGGRGGQTVSMEEIIRWNPQVILCSTEKGYEAVTTGEAWKGIQAVKDGRVYRVPDEPYNVLSSPPSANRIAGIYWLGALIYPEQYASADWKEKIREWYKLAYHHELTDEELNRYFFLDKQGPK